ncbi:unnamed protein product [Owenia fusiformis]|uniref:Uncharacterized protein n=1 Tax=Owenia fusiformis TaxID=6347 RepID=A0A8J1XUH2_OWEFU|nr:unnamed protein product [Owenia fusiformis]
MKCLYGNNRLKYLVACTTGAFVLAMFLWSGHIKTYVDVSTYHSGVDKQIHERTKCDCDDGVNKSKTFKNVEVKATPNDFKVPNIVHYCWYSNMSKEWTFTQYLSVLSVHRFIKPSMILFQTNYPPHGYYWNRTVSIPGLTIVKRTPTKKLFWKRLNFPYETTACNLDRLLFLNTTGGMVLDTDVIAVRSFDPLRKYSATMGSQNRRYFYDLCGGIIIAEPGSTFIKLWINSFIDDYRPDIWAFNSGRQPAYIGVFRFPESLHIERTSLNLPGWEHTEQIFAQKYDWTNNYAIHLFLRKWKQHKDYKPIPTEMGVGTANTTFGEIARLVLYGSTDLFKDGAKRPDVVL